MNGLNERNRTMGELLTELRARLGFMTQGAAALTNETTIKSFLREAHDYVYAALDPPVLRQLARISLSGGSCLYDWHDDVRDADIDPAQVLSVWLEPMGQVDQATRLAQGIDPGYRSEHSLAAQPLRYDTLDGQIELCPVPDQVATLVVEHIAAKSRFEQAADRTSVPDRLVFLYALATAKAHYRHPDAQASAASFQNMLSIEKSKQKGNRRFFVKGSSRSESALVGRGANGYRLQG